VGVTEGEVVDEGLTNFRRGPFELRLLVFRSGGGGAEGELLLGGEGDNASVLGLWTDNGSDAAAASSPTATSGGHVGNGSHHGRGGGEGADGT